MRLIDADALKKSIKNMPNDYYGDLCIGDAIKEIDNAPTIDAAPVVRGEWILQGENEHDYETSLEEKCSLCGRYVYRYDTQPQDNYCPNCGAKMESEGST